MASEITVYPFHLSQDLKEMIKGSKAFHLLMAKLDDQKECICLFMNPKKTAVAQVIQLSFMRELVAYFGNEKKALKALFKCFKKQLYAVDKMPIGVIDNDLAVKVGKVLKLHKDFELTEQGEVVAIFTMTIQQALKEAAQGKKITHSTFTESEYITTENGLLVFEDGVSAASWCQGMEQDRIFQDDWSIYKNNK